MIDFAELQKIADKSSQNNICECCGICECEYKICDVCRYDNWSDMFDDEARFNEQRLDIDNLEEKEESEREMNKWEYEYR